MTIENLSFEKLRERPLPECPENLSSLGDYKKIPIVTDSPLHRERLVNLLELGIAGINIYHSRQNPPYFERAPGAIPELFARESVARKLLEVNQFLARFELELFVLDAYRPLSVQSFFVDFWVPRFLRKQNPEKSEAWIKSEVSKYWSAAPQSKEDLEKRPPPHSTGAAIDLTIRFKETKIPLEMGGIFDDASERSHFHYYEKRDCRESYTESEAQKNRRLFHHVMTHFGFTAHPREWWHFSCGDQLSAYLSGKESAHYGYAG